MKICTTIHTAFSHKFVLRHLVVQMFPHGLLGLLCELELGPGRPLLGELVDLCIQVLLLHQVDSIPDDTQNKSKILLSTLNFTLKPRLAQTCCHSLAKMMHF